MAASRVLSLVAAAIFAAAAPAVGQDLSGSPALVVEADSGKVLFEHRATDPWFPASITKLMTTYVALEQVADGKIAMDTLLTVSARAKSQPPSKMNFKVGTEIRLDNALKILMVKSANDVSVTVAEGIGGSVEGFAELMNDAAQRLGMMESHFVNPHGLPDSRQQTSARDMAILARALLHTFPQHQELFSIGAIQLGRRVMANHNGLIGRYPGADGMKTGFICSSGFNVVATATRHGRRLITVVLGSPSAAERTFRAADLFDLGFNQSTWGLSKTVASLQPSVLRAPPDMRPYICERRGPAAVPSEEDGSSSAPVQAGLLPMPEAASGGVLPPSALAFAGLGAAPGEKRRLGPRAALEPIPVWLGASPGGSKNAEETAEAKPKARASRTAARPAPKPEPAAEASAAPAKPRAPARPGAIARQDDGEAKPASRTGLGAIPRKPAPAGAVSAADGASEAAKPAPAKPGARPAAKPKPAAKPLALGPKAAAEN